MTSWFASQATTGSGKFTRQVPNRSAKTTYNRLQSPEGLIWIAEALGADPDLVQTVVDEALTIPRKSRSGFIRKHLPWQMIATLAKSQQESRHQWIRTGRAVFGRFRVSSIRPGRAVDRGASATPQFE